MRKLLAMNEESANRKAINFLDNVANIANAWLGDSDKHALVNYLNSKLNTEK